MANLRGLLAVAVVALSGCTPADPALEATLSPPALAKQGRGTSGGGGVAIMPPGQARPEFDPRDRVPNTNPRVLTNNVYGPGKSSDAFGRVVYHNPGLRIEQTYPGAADYTDQYGRPVTCRGTGMGTYCR